MGNNFQKQLQEIKKDISQEIPSMGGEIIDFRFVVTQNYYKCMILLIVAQTADQIDVAASAVDVFEAAIKSCFNTEKEKDYNDKLKEIREKHTNGKKEELKIMSPKTLKARKKYQIQKFGVLLKMAADLGITRIRSGVDEF